MPSAPPPKNTQATNGAWIRSISTPVRIRPISRPMPTIEALRAASAGLKPRSANIAGRWGPSDSVAEDASTNTAQMAHRR